MEEIIALILAAGRGTRLLPATKAVPKEMVPLVDRPLIHYTLEEALSAGIDHAIIVTAGGKDAVHQYFDPAPELERLVAGKAESRALASIEELIDSCSLTYVRQRAPKGIADAVMTARRALGGRPFVLYFPDDVIIGEPTVTQQLLKAYHRHHGSIIAAERVPRSQVSRYGIIDGEPMEDGIYRVRRLVEKPKPEEAPSDLAIVGRYVITPRIFDAIKQTEPGANGELQITDALQNLLTAEPVYALQFTGRRYDTGNPAGLLRTAVALALERPDIAEEVRGMLRELLDTTG